MPYWRVLSAASPDIDVEAALTPLYSQVISFVSGQTKIASAAPATDIFTLEPPHIAVIFSIPIASTVLWPLGLCNTFDLMATGESVNFIFHVSCMPIVLTICHIRS